MSSPFELGQEVLSAQGQIFARSAAGIAWRMAYVVVALVFLLLAVVSFHGVLWALLRHFCHLSDWVSALCVMGADLLGCLLFTLLACRKLADFGQSKARQRRDQKLHELKQAVAVSTLLGVVCSPVGRYAGGSLFRALRSMFGRRRK